jgi:ABC-type glycerol-3-phosphate transport system substrate-binding protein
VVPVGRWERRDAMVVSGPWDVVNAKSSVKFDFGLATMPKGSKGSITVACGSGFGISSSAKDRNLTFKAITALTSDEAEERLASVGLLFPLGKPNKPLGTRTHRSVVKRCSTGR